jgi:phage/plasmid-like protein (TIGR03299 family)
MRSSDKSILGTVGERYEVLQNIEAFNVFQPFLDMGLVRLNTAGSLYNGQKVWILAEIIFEHPLEIRPNDSIRKFILLSHGHDGKSPVKFGLTPIRVVCANTLQMAHTNNDSKLFKIRHTKNMSIKIENARDVIYEMNECFNATASIYRNLDSKSIDQEWLDKYIKNVFKITEEIISTRQHNIIERIKSNFRYSPGAKGKSAWDAYNAITYYISHEHGNNDDNRLKNLWFGQNVELSQNALKLAIDT